MKEKSAIAGFITLVSLLLIGGCAPSSFVQSSPGWKVIELRDELHDNYDQAWQVTVDTVARNWDIEILDKDSGYLRTNWTYGISGRKPNNYRGRLSIKYPTGKPKRVKLEVKTEAQWHFRYWHSGFDTIFNRDVYASLSGRLGRTVPTK
ncbi:MAG: hypothetical protein ACYS6W_09890 [Planctomycetota bacterium]|jgi:hypothetical protein